ncbi:MAG: hypothetical protein AYK23_02760 [Candidatus Proteinoplasmatales archaeon SG8-5]|nr:MAG: hypothetical protein AYK23_02760 [Candidatus Proteinoplasmatales archaeon SG8-5]
MSRDSYIPWKIKLIIWSISGGIIVAFFIGMNIMSWATSFNPGGTMIFISPLVCGFILGILTWEFEISHTVFGTILLTITATIGIIFVLLSPKIFGVAEFIEGYYLYVIQNIILTVVLTFPVSLLGAIVGKFLTGTAILSPQLKAERAFIRAETEQWYQMLEEYIEAKEASGAPLPFRRNEEDAEK